MSVTQNPYKKIIQRGNYTILPIIGDSVSELCLRRHMSRPSFSVIFWATSRS